MTHTPERAFSKQDETGSGFVALCGLLGVFIPKDAVFAEIQNEGAEVVCHFAIADEHAKDASASLGLMGKSPKFVGGFLGGVHRFLSGFQQGIKTARGFGEFPGGGLKVFDGGGDGFEFGF
jgi:hypothetical protein